MGKKKSESASFPVIVVKKKMPDTFLYRLPKDKTKCYRFHYKFGVKSVVCTSCRTIGCVARRNAEPKLQMNSRKFDGSSTVVDPELCHLPGCQPDVYADMLRRYSLNPQVGKRGKFYLARVQKKLSYFVLYRLPGDKSKCYRFNLRRIGITEAYVTCAGCLSRCTYIRTANKRGVIWRHLTEAGFIIDPASAHRHDCQPELYSKVISKYEVVDSKAAQQFLTEHFGQAENNKETADSLVNNTMLQQDVGLTSLSCKKECGDGRDNRSCSADYQGDHDISDDRPTSSRMKSGKRGRMPTRKNEKRGATSDISSVSTSHVRRSSRLVAKIVVPENEEQEEAHSNKSDESLDDMDDQVQERVDSLDGDDIPVDCGDGVMSSSDEYIERNEREDWRDSYPHWPYNFASSSTNVVSNMGETELHNGVCDAAVEEPQPSIELFETVESTENLNDVRNNDVLDALPEEETLAANIYSTDSQNYNPLTSNQSFNGYTTEKNLKTEFLEVESTESLNDDDSDIVFVEPFRLILTRRSDYPETSYPANVSVVEEHRYEDVAHETNRTDQRTNIIASQKQPVDGVKTEAAESKPQDSKDSVEILEPRTKKIKIDEDDDDDIIVVDAAGPAFTKATINSTNAVVAGVRPPELTINEGAKPLTDVTHVEQRTMKVSVPRPRRISLASYVEVLNTFDFKPGEISITQDGRLIRVEFPRQEGSVSLTNSLSYCVEPPESVDIATIRTSWREGKLTIIGENL